MKRGFWLYGVAMGILLLLMQIIHYQTLIRDLQLELFGFVIALVFMGVGVWLGINVYQKVHRGNQPGTATDHQGISERELEVLVLLADGLSNQEIADRLFVSLNTIKTHVSSIYQKLNAKRRTQAIQKARDLGIISSPEGVS